MSLVMPAPDGLASRVQITIDDTPYSLLLTWNERAGAYNLGLEDRDGAPVLYGRRIVLQLGLLAGYHHLPGVPAGDFYALDVTGGGLRSVGREDLIEGRAVLYYIPRSEIDAL